MKYETLENMKAKMQEIVEKKLIAYKADFYKYDKDILDEAFTESKETGKEIKMYWSVRDTGTYLEPMNVNNNTEYTWIKSILTQWSKANCFVISINTSKNEYTMTKRKAEKILEEIEENYSKKAEMELHNELVH